LYAKPAIAGVGVSLGERRGGAGKRGSASPRCIENRGAIELDAVDCRFMRHCSRVICSVYEIEPERLFAKHRFNACRHAPDAYSARLFANRLYFAGAMRNGKNADTRFMYMVNPRFGARMPKRTFTPVARARQAEAHAHRRDGIGKECEASGF